MFLKRAFIIAVVVLCGIANSNVVKKGYCPIYIKVVENFNIEKYMGFWHEYARYPYKFEENSKCNAAAYSLEADGRVRVNNSQINRETGLLEDIVGYATPVENGKLQVVFPVAQTFSASSNYWVLDTDYGNYSVVYSCEQVKDEYTTYVWILMRQRDPPMNMLELPLQAMLRNHIRLEHLNATEQYQCSDSP